ncbi:MAG: cytochrome c [Deltaproteobacteria bacterium]|nr:cytochrome c [Deltaproteobacteria bacterium]
MAKKEKGKGSSGKMPDLLEKNNLKLVILAMVTLGLGVGAILWAMNTTPDGAKYRASPETLALGKRLYEQNCQICHGEKGVGQDIKSPKGGMDADGKYLAPALNGTGHAWHHKESDLFSVIKDGSPAPDSTMRGWSGKMTDEDIRSVIGYFQSLWPDALLVYYKQNINQDE